MGFTENWHEMGFEMNDQTRTADSIAFSERDAFQKNPLILGLLIDYGNEKHANTGYLPVANRSVRADMPHGLQLLSPSLGKYQCVLHIPLSGIDSDETPSCSVMKV